MVEAIRIHTAGDRRAAARLVHRAHLGQLASSWCSEDGGFLYSSDSYADDLPYWVNGPNGPHLIVPYTLDANDMRFINPQGFANGDEFFAYLKRRLRRALCRGRARAEDDVGRPALPARRPARTRRRRWRASSITSRATTGSGSRPGSTSRGTGTREHEALAAERAASVT